MLQVLPDERPFLQAGDVDQDLDFDQFDLIRVQQAAKYLSGQPATWGEGDWNGAPGGRPGEPPRGDGVFNQFDIIAAQQAAIYLTGPYAGIESEVLATLPEPRGLVLLTLGLLGIVCSSSRIERARR